MTDQLLNSATKTSNKRLMFILWVTVALTIWTALQQEVEVENFGVDDLEVSRYSRVPRQIPMRTLETSQQLQVNVVSSYSDDGSLIPWGRLKREPLIAKPHDLFKVHSWVVVPRVKKIKPPPPPPPSAPPAPFQYVGKIEDSPKGTQVFLMLNGKLYIAFKGEKINQQWRFEAEDSNTLKLTYLPLNLVQTLSKATKTSTALAKPLTPELLAQ